MGKKKDRIYSLRESYMDRSFKNSFYSMQRIDLIIISLSTGCIVGLLTYIEQIKIADSCCLTTAWFISISLFSLSIMFNIAGQLTSHRSNATEGKWAYNELKRLNKMIDENDVGDNLTLEKYTNAFNWASLLSLLVGFLISIIALATIVY